ncbi:MAG: glycosyl hydrolase [Fibrobacteres bacterium]|nr:glycosyl hydrolase [Fibrobacterota bacterium]
MFQARFRILAVSLAVSALSLVQARAQNPAFRVLVFSGTGGFVHDCIPAANKFMQDLGAANNFTVDVSNAASVFTAANLAKYKVIVWNNTTKPGSLLNLDQRAAFLAWAKTNGYFGLHAALDTEGSWPEIIDWVGVQFSSHGTGMPTVRLDPEGKGSEVTAGVGDSVKMDEEWYSFKSNPRGIPGLKVLYAVDESTCPYCVKMGDHPVAWIREHPATGGRVFYMAMGHMPYVYQNHAFSKKLMLNAMLWVAKAGTPSVALRPARPAGAEGAANARVETGVASLTIAFPEEGSHSLLVSTLQGKRIAARQGHGRASYAIGGLQSGMVYSVASHSSAGSVSKLVLIP